MKWVCRRNLELMRQWYWFLTGTNAIAKQAAAQSGQSAIAQQAVSQLDKPAIVQQAAAQFENSLFGQQAVAQIPLVNNCGIREDRWVRV